MNNIPYGVDINNLIDDLRILSWEAADILLGYSSLMRDINHRNKIIKSKEHEDPVTLADLKVNELIIKRIQGKYKNIDWEILSEENAKIQPYHCNTNADWLWVLDPLDGTKDFIENTGNYAMHLALNYKKKPCLGIVLIPDKDELWISNNKIVLCERRNGDFKKPNLSCKFSLKDMTIVTSKNHRSNILQNLIDKANFKKVVVMGSIGCKIASILRGESDIYICLSLPGKSTPKDWDFSAPAAVLKAAGGAITNLHNQELIYGKSNYEQGGIIVATSNNVTHKNICLKIKEVVKKYNLYPFDFN